MKTLKLMLIMALLTGIVNAYQVGHIKGQYHMAYVAPLPSPASVDILSIYGVPDEERLQLARNEINPPQPSLMAAMDFATKE